VQKAVFMFISDFIWGLISTVLPDLYTYKVLRTWPNMNWCH